MFHTLVATWKLTIFFLIKFMFEFKRLFDFYYDFSYKAIPFKWSLLIRWFEVSIDSNDGWSSGVVKVMYPYHNCFREDGWGSEGLVLRGGG